MIPAHVNGALFSQYDDLGNKINRLSNVDGALASSTAEMNRTGAEISSLQSNVANAQHAEKKLVKRIHRNENPRFLHYFVINRKQKVERLKGELDTVKSNQVSWHSSIKSKSEIFAKQQQEVGELTNTRNVRDSYAKEQQQIFDTVVQACPSPRLTQIDANISKQRAEIQRESGLQQQMDNMVNQIRQGQQMYGRALQMLESAANSNEIASIVNRRQRLCDIEDLEQRECERRRLDDLERQEQHRRDRLINEAQTPANDAYMMIAQAWTQFPNEARMRYPQLSAQIGQTPLPQLRRANYAETMVTDLVFGDKGAAVNNAMAYGKIDENIQIIRRCNAIIEQQLQLVQALRTAIISNIASMEGNLHTLESQRTQETKEIFNRIRSMVLSTSPNQNMLPHAEAVPVY